MGFMAESIKSCLDVEVGGISDENIPRATERLSAIDGIINVEFPNKNDSSHVRIIFDSNKTDQYLITQSIQSIGYQVQPNRERISKLFLRVQGMHCNSCVMNITGTVEDLPGIEHVRVTFDDQSAEIHYDKEIIRLNMIVEEIEKLGFQVAIASTSDKDKSSGEFITVNYDHGLLNSFLILS